MINIMLGHFHFPGSKGRHAPISNLGDWGISIWTRTTDLVMRDICTNISATQAPIFCVCVGACVHGDYLVVNMSVLYEIFSADGPYWSRIKS